MKMMTRLLISATMLVVLAAPSASALTIITSFVGGNPPAETTGGGNMMDIVNAAARIWESAYTDDATITLYFGWASVGDAGIHSILEQGGFPNREIKGIILFDNSGSAKFYLDPTPDSNEEFSRRTVQYQDLGGGMINVARLFSGATGDAEGHVDLLSVALHEIGHALGMSGGNLSFVQEAQNGAILVLDPLAPEGTSIPLASNKSGITSHIDALKVVYGAVMAGISSDERRLPSDADILANAQVSGFTPAESESAASLTRVSPRTSPGVVSGGIAGRR
jgi:hypothetical protein